MSVQESFPLLDGWEKRLYSFGRMTLNPNEEKEVIGITGRGWVHSMVFVFDNPFIIMAFQEREYVQELSPYELWAIGNRTPDSIAWISRYDPNSKLYVFLFKPAKMEAWTEYSRLLIRGPSKNELTGATITSQSTMLAGKITYYNVIDRKKFIRSYRKLIYGNLWSPFELVEGESLSKYLASLTGQKYMKLERDVDQ